MTPLSSEVVQLLRSLLTPPFPLERVRGDERRRQALSRLASLADFRVVPSLIPIFAAGDKLSRDVARAIAVLLSGITPTALAWIDEQVRNYSYTDGYWWHRWWNLSPAAVHSLSQAAGHPVVIGVIASHPSGYVREAAVLALAAITDGRELPFLALRANDWADAVAERAGEFLSARLVPENRHAVLSALPFLVRMLGQQRRDHKRFLDATKVVLLSDGGRDALSRLQAYDTHVRRFVYRALESEMNLASNDLLRTALADTDAVVRLAATRRLATTRDLVASQTTLETLSQSDPAPAVRKQAFSILADRAPDRARDLLPAVLLDSAPRVRELARYLVRGLDAPIVPQQVYVEGLAASSTRAVAAAIDGLGETGTPDDAHALSAFVASAAPRIRRAVLRAFSRLDRPRARAMAMDALTDDSGSVRAESIQILAADRSRVDFDQVWRIVRGHHDPHARQRLLVLIAEAPKWAALTFLLEAVGDTDASVRQEASLRLDVWCNTFNRTQVPPSPLQLGRVRTLLQAHDSLISRRAAEFLYFVLRSP